MDDAATVYVIVLLQALGAMTPVIAYCDKDSALRWLNNHGTIDHSLVTAVVEDLELIIEEE